MAQFYFDVGEHHLRRTFRLKDAERSFQAARESVEKLTAEFPSETGYRKQLARLHQRLGDLLPAHEAETAFRTALEIYAKLLVDTHDERGDFLEELGHCRRQVAFRDSNAGHTEQAEQLYRQALGDFEKLSADYPDVASHQYFVADTQREIGRLLAHRRQFPEAEEAYRRAIEIHHQRMARFPTSPLTFAR